MALELLGVERFELRLRVFFIGFLEAVALPAGLVHLEDPGRLAFFILIGVRADDAMGRLLEKVVELAHRARRAHPAETIGLQHHGRLEMIPIMLADHRIDAIGRHHDIGR